jgi:hypothetical protein
MFLGLKKNQLAFIIVFLLSIILIYVNTITLSQKDQSNLSNLQMPNKNEQLSASSWASYIKKSYQIKSIIFIDNIHNPSLKEKTYFANGTFYLQWTNSLQDLIDQKKINPLQLVEFSNQVEQWNSVLELGSSSHHKVDGVEQYLQEYRFSGRFYLNNIDLHNSPFNDLELSFILTVNPRIHSSDNRPIVLVPFENYSSILGENSTINGYDLLGAKLEFSIQKNTKLFEGDDVSYTSRIIAKVLYRTNIWTSFVKWIVPLAIVMAIVLTAPSLDSSLNEIRLTIPPTVLLTLIFLQQSYRENLPLASYLTFLDKLYAFSYLVSIAIFLVFVWSGNILEKAKDTQKSQVISRVNQMDLLVQLLSILGFVLIFVSGLIKI